jgi:competence protein ComEC
MKFFSIERWRFLVLLTLSVGIGVVGTVSFYIAPTESVTPYLTVHFLDVGQGDAIFIETPDKVQVLVDGGPDGSVVRELGSVMGSFDKTIDLVVATHNDKDHIGGLVDVLARYQVAAIMRTNNEHDTNVARQFAKQVELENAVLLNPEAGQKYILGASTTLTIFSPTGDVKNHESNASSIVTKIQYGETAFFLTGDAPIGIEEYLVRAYGPHLSSDVLKLGHHGSRTSTGEMFVKTVSPTYAVVSAGRGNSYGHPHVEVTNNVANVGSELVSTAEQGRITFISDGTRVWQK